MKIMKSFISFSYIILYRVIYGHTKLRTTFIYILQDILLYSTINNIIGFDFYLT